MISIEELLSSPRRPWFRIVRRSSPAEPFLCLSCKYKLKSLLRERLFYWETSNASQSEFSKRLEVDKVCTCVALPVSEWKRCCLCRCSQWSQHYASCNPFGLQNLFGPIESLHLPLDSSWVLNGQRLSLFYFLQPLLLFIRLKIAWYIGDHWSECATNKAAKICQVTKFSLLSQERHSEEDLGHSLQASNM